MRHSPYNFILVPRRRFASQVFILGGCFSLLFFILSGVGDITRDDRGALFIVDTSLSMSTEDIVSEDNILTSRLDTARNLLKNIGLTRPTALMTFAGSAKLQLPLSIDKQVWDEVVNAIEVVRYGSPTDIETAIASAMFIYGKEDSIDIYVLTDGERTSEGEGLDQFNALSRGTNLHIIGIGTTEGGKIVNNYDGDGRIVYKKYEGKEILSRLDKDYLESLGKQYNVSPKYIEKQSDIIRIQEFINTKSKTDVFFVHTDMVYTFSSFLIIFGIIMRDYRKK